MDQTRSETATPQKRARARAAGLVARSAELPFAATLLAFAAVLGLFGVRSVALLERLLVTALRAAALPAEEPWLPLAHALRELGWLLSATLLGLALAAWLGGFVQVGPLFSARALAPEARRLDPLVRLRALWSREALETSAFALVKACGAGAVVAVTLLDAARAVLALGRGDAEHAAAVLGRLAGALCLRVGVTLGLFALVDLVLRRMRHERSLRMSRRELTQEQREQYGLPEQRSARRRAFEAARAQAELAALESASLLLVDHNGRALGLRFDAADERERAPRVVLKAQGALALQIQARAALLSLPSRLEPNLCARLYLLELSEEVPRAYYDAVAAVFRSLTEPPS